MTNSEKRQVSSKASDDVEAVAARIFEQARVCDDASYVMVPRFLIGKLREAIKAHGIETSEQHDSIPARPYPGDEEAVRQSGVALPYCSCSRASDDPHTSGCKFWLGILAARKLWMDRNVAAWSCAPEARGEKRCAQWCGHPQFCTASGTDRRRSQKALEQPPVDNDHVADGCEKFDE